MKDKFKGLFNRHSLVSKIMFLVGISLLIFVVTMLIMTSNMLKTQYKVMEKEKLDTIISTVTPALATNLIFGFEDAVREECDALYLNDGIVQVHVKHEGRIIKECSKPSSVDLSKTFSKEVPLVDIVQQKKIGSFTLYYSKEHFKHLRDKFYRSMWIFAIFYLLFMGLLFVLFTRTLRPLSLLSKAMKEYTPQQSKAIALPMHDESEVGLITKSANAMIGNINSFSKDLMKLNKTLQEREAHMQEAQRMAHVGSWELDVTHNEFTMSSEMYRILGIKASTDVNYKMFKSFIVKDNIDEFLHTISHSIEEGATFDIVHGMRKKNGVLVYVHTKGKTRKKEGRGVRLSAVSMDITQQTKAQEMIEHLAFYDPLTNLPNRTYLAEKISKLVAQANHEKHSVAVLFIDLDRFKVINDTLGHEVGDALLVEVSKQLKTLLRHEDILARIGGDEFIVVMPNLIAQEQAISLAKKIIHLMQNKWSIASHELIVTCSIGIALYPLHTASEDVLIKFADIAMYHAKERGRNNWQLFEKNMSINVQEQFTLEQDLREAIKADDQLCAYFQPKIALATGKVVGAECLVRWHHPNGDTIYPDEFIALAENTGLILEIGQKVMRQSLQMIKNLYTKYGAEVQIAVNLSGRQFQYQGLPTMVEELLKEFDVPAHLLELEITETISMQDITRTLHILTQLKSLGVDLAIDDFGTGYSSLAYLKQFPVDTLKIDKSFVMDMVEDGEDRSIVEAIVLMAKAMQLKTVAEGVETQGHVQALQYMQCDYVQGYHYYKALPPQEFDTLLSKQDKSFT